MTKLTDTINTEHLDHQAFYANLALAYCQIGYGWNLRGGGYASEVSKEGWQGFATMLSQAEKTLNEKSADRKTCMAWYRAMQHIGIGLGWPKDKLWVWSTQTLKRINRER